jgi:ankyrin repeat protein
MAQRQSEKKKKTSPQYLDLSGKKPEADKRRINAEKQKRLNSSLFLAAAAGNDSNIMRLIMAGADIAARDNGGWTALSHAAEFGYAKSCKLLMQKYSKSGGNLKKLIASKNMRNQTALHHAADDGSTETCSLLIEEYARLSGNVKKLIAARDNDGWTPLHYAATYSDPEPCALLIEKYAESGGDVKTLITATDKNGITPLQKAAEYGYTKTAQFLAFKLLEAMFGDETASAFLRPFRDCIAA